MMTLPPTYQHTGERSDVRIVGANFDRAAEPFSKFLRDPVNPVWASRHESVGSVRLLRTYGDHAARIDVSRRNGLRSTPSVGVQM